MIWTERYSDLDRKIVSFTPKNALFCPKRYSVLNRKMVSFGRFDRIRARGRRVRWLRSLPSFFDEEQKISLPPVLASGSILAACYRVSCALRATKTRHNFTPLRRALPCYRVFFENSPMSPARIGVAPQDPAFYKTCYFFTPLRKPCGLRRSALRCLTSFVRISCYRNSP